MTDHVPTLHMLYGKIASGKSTLSTQLAEAPLTVLISADDWLGALFGDQMSTGADFVKFFGKLQAAMAPHIVELLRSGVSVVLDFPANTVDQRAWMRGVFEEAQVAHTLHVLDVPDETCLARLRARNATGDHPFAPTEAQFLQFMKYVTMPSDEEGFNIVRHM